MCCLFVKGGTLFTNVIIAQSLSKVAREKIVLTAIPVQRLRPAAVQCNVLCCYVQHNTPPAIIAAPLFCNCLDVQT